MTSTDRASRTTRICAPLEEIAELLHTWETGACAQVKTELRPRLRARLADAEQRRDEVVGFIAALQAALAHLDALADRSSPCDPNCGFLAVANDAHPPVEDAGRGRWRDAPVACSLTVDGISDRAEQWRSALTGAMREPIPDGPQLTVPIQRLTAVADLAATEQACCPFFDFRFHLDGSDLHLQVRASAEGQTMLTDLFDSTRDLVARRRGRERRECLRRHGSRREPGTGHGCRRYR